MLSFNKNVDVVLNTPTLGVSKNHRNQKTTEGEGFNDTILVFIFKVKEGDKEGGVFW